MLTHINWIQAAAKLKLVCFIFAVESRSFPRKSLNLMWIICESCWYGCSVSFFPGCIYVCVCVCFARLNSNRTERSKDVTIQYQKSSIQTSLFCANIILLLDVRLSIFVPFALLIFSMSFDKMFRLFWACLFHIYSRPDSNPCALNFFEYVHFDT